MAKYFAKMLAQAGVAHVEICHDNVSALAAIDTLELDAAFVDVGLAVGTSEVTADALAARNIPFVFLSGRWLPDALAAKFPDRETLIKPVRKAAIEATLAKLA